MSEETEMEWVQRVSKLRRMTLAEIQEAHPLHCRDCGRRLGVHDDGPGWGRYGHAWEHLRTHGCWPGYFYCPGCWSRRAPVDEQEGAT